MKMYELGLAIIRGECEIQKKMSFMENHSHWVNGILVPAVEAMQL